MVAFFDRLVATSRELRLVASPRRAITGAFLGSFGAILVGLSLAGLLRPVAPTAADVIATVVIAGPVVVAFLAAVLSAFREGSRLVSFPVSLALVATVPAAALLFVGVSSALGGTESDLALARMVPELAVGVFVVGSIAHAIGVAARVVGNRRE